MGVLRPSKKTYGKRHTLALAAFALVVLLVWSPWVASTPYVPQTAQHKLLEAAEQKVTFLEGQLATLQAAAGGAPIASGGCVLPMACLDPGRSFDFDFVQKALHPWLTTSSQKWGDLWVRGAGVFPGLMLEMVVKHTKPTPASPANIIASPDKVVDTLPSKQEDRDRLFAALKQFHSDKGRHGYHLYYTHVFDSIVKNEGPVTTLEIGMGTNNGSLISTMGTGGSPGASNRAFREYLPEDSLIYAADVDRNIIYQEERIKTGWVDQLSRPALDELLVTLGRDTFDLIIDDGLHMLASNLSVLVWALSHVKKGGWVVIEDIEDKHATYWKSYVDPLLRTNPAFRTFWVPSKKENCYLVHVVE